MSKIMRGGFFIITIRTKPISIFIFLFALFFLNASLADDDWFVSKSKHFIIYYKELDNPFIRTLIEKAEDYYFDITDTFGFRREKFWLWEERCKIYIYLDQEEYLKNTGQPSWSGGYASYNDKIIYTFPWAKGFFDALLPHELTHIIFREFVGSRAKVPLWFEEGVASLPEMKKITWASRIISDAVRQDKIIPLKELSKINTKDITNKNFANLFYAESVSIINFLIQEYQQYRFRILCRQLKDGKSFLKAIARAYPGMKSIEDLEKKWRNYLNE